MYVSGYNSYSEKNQNLKFVDDTTLMAVKNELNQWWGTGVNNPNWGINEIWGLIGFFLIC